MSSFFRQHIPFFILYVGLLFTGLYVYNDYGISWDEGMQREDNGLVNYNYIHNDNYEALIIGNEKYHGPAFEIALIYIEKIFDLKSTRDIYLMRHLVTFLVFFLSVFFFYKILFDETKERWLAMAGTVFLILSPRIFADSFYNSKDLVFMSLIIINIYTTLKFISNPGFGTAFFHAFVTAFVIDTRVMGVIIPAFTVFLIVYKLIFQSDRINRFVIPSVVYIIIMFGFMILFWPILWKDPIHHFIASIREMSHYHWGAYLTYFENRYDTTYIPWHYIPVWIIITTPLLYLILFIVGITQIVRKALKRIAFTDFELLSLLFFFAPLLAVIILKSVVYDGWRHMFFIYPPMLMISIIGLRKLYEYSKMYMRGKWIISGGVSLYCIYILYTMIYLHPYENVYFNSIAGNSLNKIRYNFEIDYWGLSYRESLEHILKTDSSSTILICPAENPGRDNFKILPDDERGRLSVTIRPEISDYYLTAFRYLHNVKEYTAGFSITRNGVIASVYDFRNDKIKLDDNVNVGKYSFSFEDYDTLWERGAQLAVNDAVSGKFVEALDSNLEYGCAFRINPSAGLLRESYRNYVTFSVNIRSDVPQDFRLALQIDSAKGGRKHWDGNDFEFYCPNKWTNISWTTILPKGLSSSDKMIFYAWNIQKSKLQLDDPKIDFYSVPEARYKEMRSKYPFAFIRDKD